MKLIAMLSCILILSIACKKEKFNTPPTVNAGKDTTIELTKSLGNSITLSGSAKDKEGTVISYLWSLVSGPAAGTTIWTPGSATTKVHIQNTGTYVFQLMATDNEGAVGVKTVTVIMSPAPVLTLNLQPASNPNEMLLAVNFNGDASSKNPVELTAAAWTSGGSPAYVRSMFKFDFTALAPTTEIITAKLYLYSHPTPLNGNLINANFGSNNVMLVQRVATDWNTNTTWQTQPPQNSSPLTVSVPHTTSSMQDIEVDVTSLVKAMVVQGNYGFMIKLQTETGMNSRIFTSSRFADASKRPKLVVQYTN